MTIYKYNVPGVYNIPLKQVLDTTRKNSCMVHYCQKTVYILIFAARGDRDLGTYIGTVQDDVWHVFYEKIKDGKKNEIIEREHKS